MSPEDQREVKEIALTHCAPNGMALLSGFATLALILILHYMIDKSNTRFEALEAKVQEIQKQKP